MSMLLKARGTVRPELVQEMPCRESQFERLSVPGQVALARLLPTSDATSGIGTVSSRACATARISGATNRRQHEAWQIGMHGYDVRASRMQYRRAYRESYELGYRDGYL